MAIKKDNEARVGTTPCDMCSQPATTITDDVALCSHCASSKKAEDTGGLLKNASVHLAQQYKPKGK